MATKQITVERFSVVSAKSFDAVVAAVDAAIGHPNGGKASAWTESRPGARPLSLGPGPYAPKEADR